MKHKLGLASGPTYGFRQVRGRRGPTGSSTEGSCGRVRMRLPAQVGTPLTRFVASIRAAPCSIPFAARYLRGEDHILRFSHLHMVGPFAMPLKHLKGLVGWPNCGRRRGMDGEGFPRGRFFILGAFLTVLEVENKPWRPKSKTNLRGSKAEGNRRNSREGLRRKMRRVRNASFD